MIQYLIIFAAIIFITVLISIINYNNSVENQDSEKDNYKIIYPEFNNPSDFYKDIRDKQSIDLRKTSKTLVKKPRSNNLKNK